MFSEFEFAGKLNSPFVEGEFKLPLSSIRAYLKEPITPRPGLDLTSCCSLKQGIGFYPDIQVQVLEQGEDLIWESGIPYTIVRPCALTEELAGADLIFDQGDNIMGKISREEVAQICVAALESPYASGKTFEVKSVVPFSDRQNPPPEKNYNVYFKTLKDGITGKEILEQDPVPV
ncbi:unnamed protein product [Prunus armeniaca]